MGEPAAALSERVRDQRAIEALRSGVPNRDAVAALGSAQPHLEQQFRQRLARAPDDLAAGAPTPGLLIGGDFGAGKSHLLEYLKHVALEQNFVCSKVVISKETPLHDPAKLFRAAITTARAPGKRGAALTEIASALQFRDPRYAEFAAWLNRPDVGLNSRFAATAFLYERVRDPEIRDRIIGVWSGDPLNVSQLRSWLRAQGEAATYKLERVSSRELPLQRFRFVPRLMAAAGYAGWVLLIDEVELIGRYSFMQRARSYAALARWAGALSGEGQPGVIAVFAITADFATAVLEDRNDAETVPGKLRASGLDTDLLLADQAERGMRLIARDAVLLRGPDRAAIERTREQVRALHATAYRWAPPPLDADDYLSTTSMRQYVRRWINEWDLRRLYPDERVETVVSDLKTDYSENRDLEVATEEEAGAEY